MIDRFLKPLKSVVRSSRLVANFKRFPLLNIKCRYKRLLPAQFVFLVFSAQRAHFTIQLTGLFRPNAHYDVQIYNKKKIFTKEKCVCICTSGATNDVFVSSILAWDCLKIKVVVLPIVRKRGKRGRKADQSSGI